MSNVDALLDFDESPTSAPPAQNGTSKSVDPFDPFGPSPTEESGDVEFLVDFGTSSKDSSTEQPQPLNPLYDMMHTNNSHSEDLLVDFNQNGKQQDSQEFEFTIETSATDEQEEEGSDHYEEQEDERVEQDEREEEQSEEEEEEDQLEEVDDDSREPEVSSSDEDSTQVVQTTRQEDGELVTETTTKTRHVNEDGGVVIKTETEVITTKTRTGSGSSEDEGEEERDHEINEVFQANRPEEIDLPEPGKGKAPSSVSSTEEKENAADSRRPRSLSRSFEEYSDMYEEYKPPKKYVKPPVKEDKGPKTVIVTDTHRTSSPNSLDNNDQSNDHSEDVSEDENAGQVDTGPHFVQTTYSSTSNGGLHTFGASQVAVPKKTDRTSLSSQPDDTPRELVRSEDHQDDGLESCPSLGNLKSKFDGPGAKAPPPPQVMATKKSTGLKASGPSSVSSASSPSEQGTPSSGEERELLRENLGEKEEIHFEGMKDIMSKWQTGDVIRGEGSYQRDATDLDEVRKAKSAGSFKSKFDAPGNKPLAYEAYVPVVKEKEEPVQQIERPKPVNVDMEDNHEAELPPPSHTKNLLAKFKEIQTGGTVPTYDRKPPKRITPPREDQQLAHQDSDEENEAPQDPNLVRSGDKANAEEALPPAGFAKNLLGKFRSLEEQAANQPPPTPERTKQTQKFAVNAQRTTYNYSAFVVAPAVNPDKPREKTPEFEAGIFENKPVKTVEDYEQQIESGEYESNPEVQDGVAREGSRIVETEFPEYGYTKNVLARFKNMQEEAAKKESENVVLRKKSTPREHVDSEGDR